MKLNKSAQKISFIFIVLMVALTIFSVPIYTLVKAEETTETETEETILSDNNYLTSLTSSIGTMTPIFDGDVNSYELILDKYDSNFTLTAEQQMKLQL